jgi:hypothetical protein
MRKRAKRAGCGSAQEQKENKKKASRKNQSQIFVQTGELNGFFRTSKVNL